MAYQVVAKIEFTSFRHVTNLPWKLKGLKPDERGSYSTFWYENASGNCCCKSTNGPYMKKN